MRRKNAICREDRDLVALNHSRTEEPASVPSLRIAGTVSATSLWVCLCKSFRKARVGACKACGLPVIAIGERGSKRQYCSDSCKRKHKRALKFVSLANEGSWTQCKLRGRQA